MEIIKLIEDVTNNSLLWSHKEFPFKAHLYPGHPRLAVVAGENCSGKSLLVQILSFWCRKHHNASHIMVSIRERTGSGLDGMAGLRRSMMFGDESEESTGAISVRVLDPAFNTLNGRTDEGKKALLIFDEPELGLSDSYASAMGAYIADKTCGLPELALGTVVVTHSRSLVGSLSTSLGRPPSFVKLGPKQSLNTWLKGEKPKTVEQLLKLPKDAKQSWHKVKDILQELKKNAS